jgi:hypothetical protein
MVLNIFFPRSQQVRWSHIHVNPRNEGDTSPNMIFLHSWNSLWQWCSDFVTQNHGVLWATFGGYVTCFCTIKLLNFYNS